MTQLELERGIPGDIPTRGSSVQARTTSFAAVLAVAAVAFALAAQFGITQGSPVRWPALLFVPAVALFAAAAFVDRRRPVQQTRGATLLAAISSARVQIAVVAGIVALAVFFRFFRFESFPPGLWYDEAVNGTDAISIIDHDHLTVWRTSNFGHSTVYFYLLILSFKTFGYTIFAFRIVPALVGVATVAAFYFLARWLLDPLPAAVATALLAVSRFAVTFSRVSWEASLQPLIEIIAVYFLFRALETGRRLYFTVAGSALAAGLYTYLGFRFVPVEIAVFLAYIAVAERRLIARNLPELALYAASFAVVVLPLGQYAVLNPDDVLARTRDINVFDEIHREGTLAPLTDNVVATLKMMNVRGDANGRHNLPNAPMLDEVSAALLVLGLAVCVWSFRNWRRGAMAVWLVLALVPGALTISAENPSGIRAVGAIPPLFLVIGLSVQFLQSVLARSRPGAVAFGVGALLLVATSGALNYHQFFGRQVHSRDVYNAFIPSYTDVAKVAVREADRGDVFLTAPFASSPIVQALTHGKNMNAIEPDALSYVPRGDRDAVVIADTGNFALAAAMQIAYPHLQRQDAVDPYGRTYFTVLTIPMAERNAPPPPPGLFTPEP